MTQEIPKANVDVYYENLSNFEHGKTLLDYVLTLKNTEIWVDSKEKTKFIVIASKMASFISSQENNERIVNVLKKLPDKTIIFTNNNNNLLDFLKKRFKNVKTLTRWDFETSESKLNEKLTNTPVLTPGYELQQLNSENTQFLDEHSKRYLDFIFGGTKKFLKTGLGFCVVKTDENKIISRASASTPIINNVLEIGIQTVNEPEYRRKGFGTIAVTALINYCLKHGIRMNWDAANEVSKKMALKLGFVNPIEYQIYSCSQEK